MLLVDIAVGDAYGAGFEFRPRLFVEENNFGNKYLPHALGNHGPGDYTDDTQMSIAIANLVIANRLSPKSLTKEDVVTAFLKVFNRDPRQTYAKHFFEFLQTVKDTPDFVARIKNDSNKSGAAMRALPGGLYKSISDVQAFSHLQASITHDTPEGRDSATAAALMYHYMWYTLGPKKELPDFLHAWVPGYDWDKRWDSHCPSEGIPCVRAALTALLSSYTPRSLLIRSVSFTGDTDTIAAIAMGVGMASREIQRDSSLDALYTGLEGGPFGKTLLWDTSERLIQPLRNW